MGFHESVQLGFFDFAFVVAQQSTAAITALSPESASAHLRPDQKKARPKGHAVFSL
jgi:hypothetical protein